MAAISANTDHVLAIVRYAPNMDVATSRNQAGGLERLYALVNDVTTRLVGAQAEEIDLAVVDCLAKLGKHFDADQVGLGQIAKAGDILPPLATWGDYSISDYLTAVPPGPEMVACFCNKGSLIWNRLEDLVELPQFQEHLRQVNAIAGAFWLSRDFGTHVEGLAMAKTNRTVWPEDTVDCLSAVGGVLFNALDRRRAEAETERMQRLERSISGVAARFVHVPVDEMEVEFNDALQQVCDATDADLCTFLWSTDQDSSTLTVSHEWNADTIDGTYFLGASLTDDYPWLARHLQEGKPLLLANPDDLPPEAEAELELFERIGIQSMVWAPFEGARDARGHIGLGTVKREGQWPNGIVLQLGVIGNILANAIHRQRADLDLAQALNEVRSLKDHLMEENETLRQEVVDLSADDELLGKSHVIRRCIFQAEQVAVTDSTVLLVGETGTGKGLIARRIHELSGRSHRPLVTVNCAALPATLIESELFGHEKGAFTGAINRKIGRFELADGGTIFLDEVGDLPIELQAKMLRVLHDGEFERLGSAITNTVDVRVISATNRGLDQLIRVARTGDGCPYFL
jgi:GAF domain-containing protein